LKTLGRDFSVEKVPSRLGHLLDFLLMTV